MALVGALMMETMRVQLITRRSNSMTGTSRYVNDLQSSLREVCIDVNCSTPNSPSTVQSFTRIVRAAGIDLAAFLESYPLHVKLNHADVFHITSQTMATLLLLRRFPGPVVVTVLDIIPYLLRDDSQLNTFRHSIDAGFYRLALLGLRRADAIIAISEYTKQTLISALGIQAERIYVTYLTVDHQKFKPLTVPVEFRQRYGLSDKDRYILYVGSEDPRKNLITLVDAFATLRAHVSGVKLLKVGRPHFEAERNRLREHIAGLGLEGAILFLDDVPDDDLPLFYNMADIFVMASLYEGFGLPVLEAMACGLPVIVAASSSLVEVTGNAGVLISPTDAEAYARAMIHLLSDSAEHSRLRQCGLTHAKKFSQRALGESTRTAYLGAIDRSMS